MVSLFGLSKKDRLKSRKEIEKLFSEGKRFSVFPLLIWYRVSTEDKPGRLRMGVSCSKRNFKKAVDRNRIKRLMREAYRLQKNALKHKVEGRAMRLDVFFIYQDKVLPLYPDMEKVMHMALAQLEKRITGEEGQ